MVEKSAGLSRRGLLTPFSKAARAMAEGKTTDEGPQMSRRSFGKIAVGATLAMVMANEAFAAAPKYDSKLSEEQNIAQFVKYVKDTYGYTDLDPQEYASRAMKEITPGKISRYEEVKQIFFKMYKLENEYKELNKDDIKKLASIKWPVAQSAIVVSLYGLVHPNNSRLRVAALVRDDLSQYDLINQANNLLLDPMDQKSFVNFLNGPYNAAIEDSLRRRNEKAIYDEVMSLIKKPATNVVTMIE